MKYLKRNYKQRNIVHLWTGKDTVCRQASTYGLNKKNYTVYDQRDPSWRICSMCESVWQNKLALPPGDDPGFSA